MQEWMSRPPYATTDEFIPKYYGSCYCGGVTLSARADPVDTKVCHCRACQILHGAPMQVASIFHKTDILIDAKSHSNLSFYSSELFENVYHLPCKITCKICKSPIADEGRNMMLMFPSCFKFDNNSVPNAFIPTCHIFYGQRMISVNDKTPKFEGHKNKSKIIDE